MRWPSRTAAVVSTIDETAPTAKISTVPTQTHSSSPAPLAAGDAPATPRSQAGSG